MISMRINLIKFIIIFATGITGFVLMKAYNTEGIIYFVGILLFSGFMAVFDENLM